MEKLSSFRFWALGLFFVSLLLSSCNPEYIPECSTTNFLELSKKLESFGIMPKEEIKKYLTDSEGGPIPNQPGQTLIKSWKKNDFQLTLTNESSWAVFYKNEIGRTCNSNFVKIKRVWIIFPDKSMVPVDLYWDNRFSAPKEIGIN